MILAYSRCIYVAGWFLSYDSGHSKLVFQLRMFRKLTAGSLKMMAMEKEVPFDDGKFCVHLGFQVISEQNSYMQQVIGSYFTRAFWGPLATILEGEMVLFFHRSAGFDW